MSAITKAHRFRAVPTGVLVDQQGVNRAARVGRVPGEAGSLANGIDMLRWVDLAATRK